MSDTVQNGARRGDNYELVIRGGATDEDYVEGGFRRGATEDGQLGPIVVTGLEGAEIGGVLSGQVASDGTVIRGEGFTVSKEATGIFVVSYASRDGSPVVTKANEAENSAYKINVFEISDTGFTISFDSGEGTAVDESFTFLVG